MFCKTCGEAMNDNQTVCLKCGVEKGKGDKFCANCGNEIPENAEVCLNCGVAIKTTETAAKAEYLNGQDKVTIALICFFFGALGVHNFMLGETKKGVMKLVLTFCLLIGGIFALIDFIKILTDSYEVNPDKLI